MTPTMTTIGGSTLMTSTTSTMTPTMTPWEWRDGTDSILAGSVVLQFVLILILITALCCWRYRLNKRARRSYTTTDSSIKSRTAGAATDQLELVVKRKSIEPLDDNYSVVKIRGAYDLLQKVDAGQTAPGFLGNPTYISNPTDYAKLGNFSGSYSEDNQVGAAVYCRLNEDCTHATHKHPDHPLSKRNKYECATQKQAPKRFSQLDNGAGLQVVIAQSNAGNDDAADDDDDDDEASEAHYSTVSLHSQDNSIYSLALPAANSKNASTVDITSPAEYEDFYTIPETMVQEAPDSSSDCEKDPKQESGDTHRENVHKEDTHYGNVGVKKLKLQVPPPPPHPKPRRPSSSLSTSAADQPPFHHELKRCVTNQ